MPLAPDAYFAIFLGFPRLAGPTPPAHPARVTLTRRSPLRIAPTLFFS